MRKLLVPAILVATFALQSFEISTDVANFPAPVSLGEVVYAVQLRKQIGPEELQKDWTGDYITPMANDSLFGVLFEKIRNKEIDVYAPTYPFSEKLSQDDAIAAISIPLEIEVEDPVTMDLLTLQVMELKRPEHVIAVLFHEEWFYDPATLTLDKKVKGIIPILDYGYFMNGETYSVRLLPLGYIPFTNGEVKQKDFSANISYNFVADSMQLLDYGDENKFVYRSSYSSPDVADMRNKLLGSLASESQNVTHSLFEPISPFALIKDKKKRTAAGNENLQANTLRFRETWSADLTQMTFSKTVKGVYFGKNLGPKPPDANGIVWGNLFSWSTYMPLNGSVPGFTANGAVTIENYYSNTAFYNLPDGNYPTFLQKDSIALSKLAVHAGMLMRDGKVPSYNREVAWEYNDPLDKRRVPLTAAEIFDLYVDTQIVMVEDPTHGDYVEAPVATDLGHEYYCGFGFSERWKFDPSTMRFEKDIKTIGVLMYVMNAWQEFRAAQPWTRYDNPNNPIDSVFQPKYLIAKNVITPCLLNYCEYYPEEGNSGQPIVSYGATYEEQIENEARYQMVQQVIDNIRAGKIKAWSTSANPQPLSVATFQHLIDSCAAASNTHPDKGREYYLFNEIRFDEDWYYNPHSGQMYKHVNALTFAHKQYSTSSDTPFGEPRTVLPGYFTVKVNGTK